MQSEVLSGWKDIANYLGKGVRTVQRYEREFGLPVHRPSGKTKGSVIATRSQLDAWVANCQISDATQSVPSDLATLTCKLLRDRIAEMDQLVGHMKTLRLEVRDSREMLLETLHRIHEETHRHAGEFGKARTRQIRQKRVG